VFALNKRNMELRSKKAKDKREIDHLGLRLKMKWASPNTPF
jgi:hypothetical protein